jgi:predicted DNA-binding protein with PD1-like motif
MGTVQFHRLSSPVEKRFLLVLEDGEDVLEELARFVRVEDIAAAEFTGIGCLGDVVFRRGSSARRVVAHRDARLVLKAFDGWICGEDDSLSAYVVVSDPSGRRFGGRMIGGHVRSVLKLVLTEVAVAELPGRAGVRPAAETRAGRRRL